MTEAHTEDEFNDTTQIEANTAKELFKYILPIINEASKKMKVILDHFESFSIKICNIWVKFMLK